MEAHDAEAAAAWDAQVDEAVALAAIHGGDRVATLYGGACIGVGVDGAVDGAWMGGREDAGGER